MNFKILKYNITLALILTGLYVVKHPEVVLNHPLVSNNPSVPAPLRKKLSLSPDRSVASSTMEQDPDSEALMDSVPSLDGEYIVNDSVAPKYASDQAESTGRKNPPSKKKEESLFSNIFNELKNSFSKDKDKSTPEVGGTSFRPKSNSELLAPTLVSQSAHSNISCVKPKVTTNLALNLKSGQVHLTWDLDTHSSYTIHRGEDPSSLESLSKVKGYEFLDSSISPGKTYHYKIMSNNSCGDAKDFSAIVSIYVPQSFIEDLSFLSASDYSLDNGVKISNNKLVLEPSNMISEKTNNGTGMSSDQVFDNYVSSDSNLTISNDLIKMNSGLTGKYISQVLDGKNDIIPWTKISFITSHPFGKELSLSPEYGYASSVTDFSNGLNYLIHFNGTIGIATTNGTNISMPISGQSAQVMNSDNLGMGFVSGPFNSALRFDGINDCVVTNYSQSTKTAYTISTWIKTTDSGDKRVIVQNRGSGAGKSLTLGMGLTGGGRGSSGKLSWLVDSDSIDIGISSVQSFNDGKWHHVVGTWAAASGVAVNPNQFKLYVDGQQVPTISSSTGNTTSPVTGLGTTTIGCHQPWASALRADLDELSSWSKVLSLNEIQELYARGANRVKLQIRTCSDRLGNDCSGTISSWAGSAGTNTSFFSEFINNSSPTTKQGTVLSSFFQSPFSLMGSSLLSWLSVGKNGIDRYIQYKAVFESDTNLSFPNLSKVSFEPSIRYSLLGKAISLKNINFYDLSKISVVQNCGDGNLNSIDDDVRYDLSFDNGSSFYSYKNNAWTDSSSFATANTKDEIESLTNSQFKTIPVGSSHLTIRSYLSSSGTTGCEIESIRIEGSR